VTDIPPPAELSEFVQALGADDTLRLIEARGGTRVWVPKTFDPDLETVAALIAEFDAPMVRAMVRRWGNGYLKVPAVKWWRARIYRAQRMEYSAIARRLGCDESSVFKWLASGGLTNKQLSLEL
jgi:hypothetical protein